MDEEDKPKKEDEDEERLRDEELMDELNDSFEGFEDLEESVEPLGEGFEMDTVEEVPDFTDEGEMEVEEQEEESVGEPASMEPYPDVITEPPRMDPSTDTTIDELPNVGPLFGRLVDLTVIIFAVIMVAYFGAFGLWENLDKVQSLAMGMLLNIGLIGLVVIVLLYIAVSMNISKGDALCRLDTKEGYNGAIEKYDLALKIDRRSKKAWTCKGLALRMQSHEKSNLKEAIRYHNMALKIDPKYSIAWVNKGNVLFNLGYNDAAIESYNKAIELDPNYTTAWVNKGELLVKLGRKDEAQKCLDRAQSLAD
jgi:tetratricopeptide (TPR) repeat protein